MPAPRRPTDPQPAGPRARAREPAGAPPAMEAGARGVREPVWLVRVVLLLVLVGFAAFLAREGRNFLHVLP